MVRTQCTPVSPSRPGAAAAAGCAIVTSVILVQNSNSMVVPAAQDTSQESGSMLLIVSKLFTTYSFNFRNYIFMIVFIGSHSFVNWFYSWCFDKSSGSSSKGLDLLDQTYNSMCFCLFKFNATVFPSRSQSASRGLPASSGCRNYDMRLSQS